MKYAYAKIIDPTRALLLAVSGLAVLSSVPLQAQAGPASSAIFGGHPSGRMHALMERTFLKVDVLTLDLCFDSETAERLARALQGDEDHVRDSVVVAALNAREAVGVIEFKRGIGLDQFLEGVAEDHDRAVEGGLLADTTRNALRLALPEWFAFLEERQILKGDRLYYRFYPDSVRTVFRDVDGNVLMQRVTVGKERRGSVLGAYFAPGSSLRDRLIESLWADEALLASLERRCQTMADPRHSS